MKEKNKSNKKDNSLQNTLDAYISTQIVMNGDGTLMTPKYSTGIYPIDDLLNGGLPQGHAIGFGASYGVGKTTLLLQVCGNIIDRYSKNVYYLDVEGGATYELIDSLGLTHHLFHSDNNPNGKLYLLNRDLTIQNITKIIGKIAPNPETAVIVIDTTTSVIDERLLQQEELGLTKNHNGYDARMWSRYGKPIMSILTDSKACLVLVHQARMDDITRYPHEVAAGGNALRHMVSAEIWGRECSYIDEDYGETYSPDKSIGNKIELKTNKNRLTKPFYKVKLPLIYGKGVSETFLIKEWLSNNSYLDVESKESKPYLIQKSSWYYFDIPNLGIKTKLQGTTASWSLILKHSSEIKSLIESTQPHYTDL